MVLIAVPGTFGTNYKTFVYVSAATIIRILIYISIVSLKTVDFDQTYTYPFL